MKKFYFALGILSLPFLSRAQVIRQDSIRLDDVVISENRLQIPFNKNVRNIQIITKKEIEKLPAKSINEVLSYLSGVDIRQRGPFGTQTDVVIDGGSFEQTLILLNGVKISDVQTAHNSMNIPVPLDVIERIEVLKGPAARVYGINALTGAINIVTTQSEKSFIKLNTYAGSSFESKEANDGSGIYWGGGFQLSGNYADANQRHLLSVSKDKYNGQRYNTATDNYKLFYQGKYNFNKQNSIDLTGGYIYNDFGANGFYAAPIDINSEEIVKTLLFSLGTKHQLTKRFSISPRISNRYNEDDYRFYKDDLSKARSMHFSNVLAAEINSSLNTEIGDFGFGIESRQEKINSSNIGNHERFNHGLYAEFKTDLASDFLINVGSYVNYNTKYGWQVFPGIDIGYLIDAKWKLAFNVGSSQRIPSFTDLYLNQRPANIGNPDLASEKAWQYEFSVHYKTEGLNFQTGYFYRNINSFIDWIRSSSSVPYQPLNVGDNRMHGFNAKMGQNLKINDRSTFNYMLSYNFLLPKQSISEGNAVSKYVLENLKHQAILNLNYSINNLNLNWSNRLIKRELKNSYFIADVRLGYKIKPCYIYADVSNLFNQTYIETAAVPLPKRWFGLGLKYDVL